MNEYEIKHEGTSQYRGVSWLKDRKIWKVDIWIKKQHKTSYHTNELDAARKVNQLCDEFGIKRRNPDIDPTPNEVVI